MKICPVCETKFQEEILFCSKDGERVIDYVPTANEEKDPLIGYVIDNKYRIESKIAEGGMSNIYRANHLQLEIPVAVKVMHERLVSDEKAIRRFRREAQSAMRIRHTNAITVLDFGVTDRKLVYLIMEYLQGMTLTERLKQQALLPLKEINNIFQQVCAAVRIAHRRGIIHRDLKPENIFIQHDGDVEVIKVLDFGIAKLQFGSEKLTQVGSSLGSPHYMAPEQLSDNENIDLRADIYSLGVILFELLTGDTLFSGTSATSVAYKHLTEKPRSILDLRSDLPEELDLIVQKALEKEVESRYEDAGTFAEELAEVFLNLCPDEKLVDSATRKVKAVKQEETDDDSTTFLRLYNKAEWPQLNVPLSLNQLPVFYQLEALFLPEFFGSLAADKVSGTTWFSYGSNIKGIVWQEGEIVFAVSNDQTERLGERLVRQGRISRQQYNRALKEQRDQDGASILDILIELDFLLAESSASLLTAHVYSICYSLIEWEEGGYAFDASLFTQPSKVNLTVGELILESVRSLIDLPRIKSFLGSEQETYLVATDWPEREKIMLRSDEVKVLEALKEPCSISNLLERIDLPEEQILRTLAALLSLRALARKEMPVVEVQKEENKVENQPITKAVSMETISLFFYELENMSAQIQRAGNDYYARLGVNPQASLEQITGSFHELKEKFDPEKHESIISQMPSLKDQILSVYSNIKEAYEKLSSSQSSNKAISQRRPTSPISNTTASLKVATQPLEKPTVTKLPPLQPSQKATKSMIPINPQSVLPSSSVKSISPVKITPTNSTSENVKKLNSIPNTIPSPKPVSIPSPKPISDNPLSTKEIPTEELLPPSLQNFTDMSKLRKPDDWYLYGLELMDKGNLEKAVRAFRQAIALRPNDAEYHAALARSYAELRNYNEQTIQEFEEAINLQPKSPDYKAELGVFYLKHNRVELAKKYIEEALAIKADHKTALKAKQKLESEPQK
ncbi:MAG: protein kinase [Blastocatellia bacterium]